MKIKFYDDKSFNMALCLLCQNKVNCVILQNLSDSIDDVCQEKNDCYLELVVRRCPNFKEIGNSDEI